MIGFGWESDRPYDGKKDEKKDGKKKKQTDVVGDERPEVDVEVEVKEEEQEKDVVVAVTDDEDDALDDSDGGWDAVRSASFAVTTDDEAVVQEAVEEECDSKECSDDEGTDGLNFSLELPAVAVVLLSDERASRKSVEWMKK